jgi:ribonuclease P protein component
MDEHLFYPPQSEKDQIYLQFGVGASSKKFKKAVDRNRIKRLTRETYRLQKNPLQDLLIERKKQMAFFVIYIGKELPNHQVVNEKIGVILQRLMKIVHESNPADT